MNSVDAYVSANQTGQDRLSPTDRPAVPGHLHQPPWLMPFCNVSLTVGLIMLFVSCSLFEGYTLFRDGQEDDPDFLVFFLHYAIAAFYIIYLMDHEGWRYDRNSTTEKRAAWWIGALLFLLSAFALNREVAVFPQSTAWLCGALVMGGMAMTAYAWTPYVGVRLQQGIYLLLAASVWLFFYASVFVAQLYVMSVPALLLLGMSIHTFVPLLITITLSRRLWIDYELNEHLRPAIWVGLMLPLLITAVFLTAWHQTRRQIDAGRNEAVLRRVEDLPEWVLIAQRIDAGNPVTDWIVNRMLGVGIAYDEGPFKRNGSVMGNLTALDDVKQHDPLVVLANWFLPAASLTATEKINILKVINLDRHRTDEKFWTGRHLITSSLVTQVRLWPQFRVSYTEKTLRIRNRAQRLSEEALYTFHLPAGSVVTSMSLWINGQEEKARLTTVAKANAAYRQVVNVESRPRERDPAVVYWLEGNRVSIRVFPCPAGQERQVKIGVTSPLRLEGSELVYENPWFEGPTASHADEVVQVDFDQHPLGLVAPFAFDKRTNGQLRYQGTYKPTWDLRLKAPALSAASFVLDGVAYQFRPFHAQTSAYSPQTVYLDLNAAWAPAEFETIWQAVRHKPVFVYDDGLVQLTDANRLGYFERLSTQQFSLFPIYRIEQPGQSLLITQATDQSIFLTDLTRTRFADRLTEHATNSERLAVISISAETAGYLETLAEFRALNLVSASPEAVAAGLGLKTFPVLVSKPNEVVLPEAAMVCRAEKYSGSGVGRAPDHLARLYGYNHLLAGIGQRYFDQSYRQNDTLLAEAQQAHVLSPLSSLIVLESERDYGRFGIKNDRKGLENATLKEEGAVPEPHEWALLALFGGTLGWLRWRSYRRPCPTPR